MWIGGHYSGTPCCRLHIHVHYIHTLTSAENATRWIIAVNNNPSLFTNRQSHTIGHIDGNKK